MYTDVNNPNTNSLYYNKTGAWVASSSRAMYHLGCPTVLRHAGVWVCAGCAAQGLCSIPGQSQPHKACSLTLPRTRMAAGVHQSHTQNKGPKLPLGVICLLHNPPWWATTAGTTTKCQSKPLNNKRHRKKLISVTHVAMSVSLQELLAVLQLCLAQPAVFTTVVAPPAYKVLSGSSSNSV